MNVYVTGGKYKRLSEIHFFQKFFFKDKFSDIHCSYSDNRSVIIKEIFFIVAFVHLGCGFSEI